MKKIVPLLIALGMLVLTGCAYDSENTKMFSLFGKRTAKNDAPLLTATPTPTATLTPTSTPTSTPTNTPTPTPKVVSITINAVGDCTLGSNQYAAYKNSFHRYYDEQGKDYFLQKVRSIFEADDCTIVNFEGTLTESTKSFANKEWLHKGKPEYINVLTGSSVEVATLGNNHIMDYLERGVKDTIKTIEDAGTVYALNCEWGDHCGIYETEEGIKLGFVSINEHYEHEGCYDYLERGLAYLRENDVNLAIACTHWGLDKTHDITDAQFAMGRWCIDAGYDLVLGAHAHILQGIEIYKGHYILYGMGNFCYGGNRNPEDKDSMIWHQTFTFVDGVLQPETDAYVIPCKLSSSDDKNDFCPMVLEGKAAEALLKNLNKYCKSTGTYIDSEGRVHIQESTQK